MNKILIVEDVLELANRLGAGFEAAGYDVRSIATLKEAEEMLPGYWPDFVLLDANFPTHNNDRAQFNAGRLLDLLVHRDYMAPSVILMSGEDQSVFHFDEIRAWFNTGRIADVLPKNGGGGWDFLKELLVHRVELLRTRRFRPELDDADRNQKWLYHNKIVSKEETMLRIAAKIRRVILRTENSASILIIGPSGSGKGVIARAIHGEMERKAGRELPFVHVRSADLDTLTSSSILGHVKGAFTGATSDRMGHLEKAGEGVVLVDDIQKLPKDVYGTLLSALQEGTFQKLGTSKDIRFKGRAILTTNVDLEELDKRGLMPEEFYQRIARDTIVIPALCQRPRDIEPLMRYFLAKHQPTPGGVPRDFSPEVIKAFQSYTWPGDVRQLENVVKNIITYVLEDEVSLGSLRSLDIQHIKGRIQWNAVSEVQQDRDFLLSRFDWHDGWSKLTESQFDEAKRWLKELRPFDDSLIDHLCTQVQSRPNPRPIHFLKALMFIALVEGNRARHSEVQQVLGLGWDFTDRVLSFLSGLESGGVPGFQPPFLVRSKEGLGWMYRLKPREKNEGVCSD